jgi:hypothetical protein
MQIKSCLFTKFWSFQGHWLYPTEIVDHFEKLVKFSGEQPQSSSLREYQSAQNKLQESLIELIAVRNAMPEIQQQFKRFFKDFAPQFSQRLFLQKTAFKNEAGAIVEFSLNDLSEPTIQIYLPHEQWGRSLAHPQAGRFIKAEIVLEEVSLKESEAHNLWRFMEFSVIEKIIQSESLAQNLLDNYQSRHRDLKDNHQAHLMQMAFPDSVNSGKKSY